MFANNCTSSGSLPGTLAAAKPDETPLRSELITLPGNGAIQATMQWGVSPVVWSMSVWFCCGHSAPELALGCGREGDEQRELKMLGGLCGCCTWRMLRGLSGYVLCLLEIIYQGRSSQEMCCCPLKISPFLLNSHSLFLVKTQSFCGFFVSGIKNSFTEAGWKGEASSAAQGGGTRTGAGA